MDVNGYSVRSAERSVGFSARPLDAFSSRRKGPAWSLPRVVLIEKRPLTEMRGRLVRGGSGVKVAAIGYGTRPMKWRAGSVTRPLHRQRFRSPRHTASAIPPTNLPVANIRLPS